ncbi:hypothetical protein D3C71_1635320 [compost metagenome]
MMGLGVPAGATIPPQETTSKPFRPDSSTVGTSGRTGTRLALVAPSTLTWPERMKGSTPATLSIITSSCPPAISTTACWPLLYGTCSIEVPVSLLSISPARWALDPTPSEPTLTLPGFFLA